MLFYSPFSFAFAVILFYAVLAKDFVVKKYIDEINSTLDKPVNEALSRFLSEEENWNKFLSLNSVDPDGVDSFYVEFSKFNGKM